MLLTNVKAPQFVVAPQPMFNPESCLPYLLQELDKLQSSAKQEVASAQAKVDFFMLMPCHIAMSSSPDTAGFQDTLLHEHMSADEGAAV